MFESTLRMDRDPGSARRYATATTMLGTCVSSSVVWMALTAVAPQLQPEPVEIEMIDPTTGGGGGSGDSQPSTAPPAPIKKADVQRTKQAPETTPEESIPPPDATCGGMTDDPCPTTQSSGAPDGDVDGLSDGTAGGTGTAPNNGLGDGDGRGIGDGTGDRECLGGDCDGEGDGDGPVTIHHRQLEVLRRVQPDYPAAARGLGLGEQTCLVELVLGGDGKPTRIDVTGCPAPFVQETEEALWRWRWSRPPADFRDVGVRTKMRVRFVER